MLWRAATGIIRLMTHDYNKNQDAISTLSPEQHRVTQRGGTGRPFDNAYWDNNEPGIYLDVVSGEPLFASSDKFEVRLRLAELHQADRAGQRQRDCATARTA